MSNIKNTNFMNQDNWKPKDEEEERRILQVMCDSLYPSAKPDSVYIALQYCKAKCLDPMTRPLHIVDFGGKPTFIMSIEFYRSRAMRTGEYMGLSDFEFGRAIQMGSVTYPEYCKVKARRLAKNGSIIEFPAMVFFKEYYKKNSPIWNQMPYGQLQTRAEKLALTRGFPDQLSGILDEDMIVNPEGEIKEVNPKNNNDVVEESTTDKAKRLLGNEADTLSEDGSPQTVLSQLIEKHEISEIVTSSWLKKAKVEKVEELTNEQSEACIGWIKDFLEEKAKNEINKN